VENKKFSFVVHYRGASPGAVRRAEAVLGEELERFEPQLGQLAGKKIWEVLPREIEGKGSAVRSLLADFPSAVLPIYVGDDTTDESAFAVLRRGLTVRVGAPGPTAARFFLRNSEEVMSFLEKLEAEIA
jgi:trehalose 6-phosphate phosphatase